MFSNDLTSSLDDDDKILGTPSAQKLLRLFSIWSVLTIKDIIEKTKLSEAQIHKTLINLQKINIIIKKKKGVYQLGSDPYVKATQEAIRKRLILSINSILNDIEIDLDLGKRDEAHNKFLFLDKEYEPIMHNNFSIRLNSLVHRFLDE